MQKILTTALLGALLGACGGPGHTPDDNNPRAAMLKAQANKDRREREMQARWDHKPVSELYAVYGSPQLKMDIPRYGWPSSEAYIYGTDQQSGCIDSFLVVHDNDTSTSTVLNYFCR